MSKGYIDVENAFEYVLKVAEKKKISKRKLCEGIYEYSSFIKICNHQKKITLEVVLLCADKLGLPFNDVLRYGEVESRVRYKESVVELKLLLRSNRFKELRNFLVDIDMNENSELGYLKKYSVGIQKFVLDNNPQYALSLFLELLDGKVSNSFEITCELFEFNNFDMFVLVTLIKILVDQNYLEKSQKILLQLIEQYYFDNKKLQLEVYILMIDSFILSKQFKEAHLYLNRAELLIHNYGCNEFIKYTNFFRIIIHTHLNDKMENKIQIRHALFFCSDENSDPYDPYSIIYKYIENSK